MRRVEILQESCAKANQDAASSPHHQGPRLGTMVTSCKTKHALTLRDLFIPANLLENYFFFFFKQRCVPAIDFNEFGSTLEYHHVETIYSMELPS